MENVNLDVSCQSIIGTFKGFLEVKEHQDIGNRILDEAVQNGVSKLIADTSELKVIRQETQKWIENEWFPKAAQVGMKFIAFIISSDALGKMSTKSVNRKSGGVEIQYFDNMNAARSWVISKS